MRKAVIVVLICLVSYVLTTVAFAPEYDILRPGGTHKDPDVKSIGSVKQKIMATEGIFRNDPDRPVGSHGIVDTITWRSKRQPDINFGFLDPGDSLLVWFEPQAACSLVAVRFYIVNYHGKILIDVYDGSKYNPKIYSLDSVDANGWIGTFDPITDPGNWVPGLWDHSPLGWNPLDSEHYFGRFFTFNNIGPYDNSWVELPVSSVYIGNVDLGRKPFFITSPFYHVSGWGFGAEYPWTTPYNFFKFYSAGTGPDGVHDGWFIRSYFIWFEAVVNYYENTPPSIKSMKVQNDTYDPGPFSITATITDNDAEDATRAGVASAMLVYDINGTVDKFSMEGSPEGGLFRAEIPELATGDVVTYWIEATDLVGDAAQSSKVTFTRTEPEHPEADVLIIWDDWKRPDLDTFCVDLFDFIKNENGEMYEFEVWNNRKHQGIDASVINWGWRTIIVSGWNCKHTLPGRDYAGNPFVEWLEAGTINNPHNLLYIDQDYFCAHPEYGCDWQGALAQGDFLHDYFGVIGAVSDNCGSDRAGYDSVAIGEGDFAGIQINFLPNAWDPTYPKLNLWPDRLVELTEDAEQIFHYKDHPEYGAGVRLDRGHSKTVYLPWQDFFIVDSLENGDLVPRPDLVEMYERILKWFGTSVSTSTETELSTMPMHFNLSQNYPNPFNATTEIRYQIPDSRSPIHTTLHIYDILGRRVNVLMDDVMESGQYIVSWDGKNGFGKDVASGIYFYQLKAGKFIATKRMILLE
ncbi:MAG: T9SS type A sorting domain-containing protein [Gemmatimonadota bacterium]|nr:MAG: T9SS type A sorting domain-containing protein [Gemmatimonadota bacterium]